jgi:AraC-like DNA-binding protein
MVLTKMNTEVDIVNVLGSIRVPTLMLQRTNDIDVKIEEGRFIAERIPGAKFVELDGSDHLFWVGNTEEVLEEMRGFITQVQPEKEYEERLFTIISAHILPPQEVYDDHQELIGRFVAQYRGEIVQLNGHTLIATFEGPSKAAHCCIDLIDALKSLSIQLAIGIHIKEGIVNESHFISRETDNFIRLLLGEAKPDQILITQAVKFLLSGAGLNMVLCKTIFEPVSGEQLGLYMITDHLGSDTPSDKLRPRQLPQNSSFLENVLQSIDAHLGDELYGVEILCNEMSISERQLQRKLKAITNKAPNQLISSVRLHRAKELLLEQNDNIAEIAFKTGFSNPSYFSKCFKKEFGISPSELFN